VAQGITIKSIILGAGISLLILALGTWIMEEKRQLAITKSLANQPPKQDTIYANQLPLLLPSIPNMQLAPIDSEKLSGISQEQRIRNAVRDEMLANMPPPPMTIDNNDYSSSRAKSSEDAAPIIYKIYDTPPPINSVRNEAPPAIQSQMTTYFYQGRAVQCSNSPNSSAQYCY
jgi:hypothetical protein